MKLALGFLLLAGGLFAQRSAFVGTGPAGSNFGSRSGFGNVLFPGTGRAPFLLPSSAFPQIPPQRLDPGFGFRLGAAVGGFPAYTGTPYGHRPGVSPDQSGAYRFGGLGLGGGLGAGGAIPIPIPMPYPMYQEPSQPNMTVVYPPPTPPVVINQNFSPEVARPAVIQEVERSSDGIRVYEPPARANIQPPPSAANEEKRSYLIALKDHTIYNAFAYWFEGDTLHYVTTHGTHNQASLDRVDRELTERLNRERNVPFRLK